MAPDEPSTLEVQIASVDHHVTVIPIGELDFDTAALLGRNAEASIAIDEHPDIDCSAIIFIDSAGLRTLMVACRHGCRIVHPSHAVVRICEISGLYELLLGP